MESPWSQEKEVKKAEQKCLDLDQMGGIHEQATQVWETGKLECSGCRKCEVEARKARLVAQLEALTRQDRWILERSLRSASQKR